VGVGLVTLLLPAGIGWRERRPGRSSLLG
jgi:hypothetical protein